MPIKEIQEVIDQIPVTQRSPHIIEAFRLREASKDVENRDYEAAYEIIMEVAESLREVIACKNTRETLRSYGFIEEDDYSITYPKNV